MIQDLHYSQYAILENGAVRKRETLRRNMFGIPSIHTKSLQEAVDEHSVYPVVVEWGEAHPYKEQVFSHYDYSSLPEIKAVYKAEWSKKEPEIPPRQFRKRFTTEEKVALYTQAKDDPLLAIFIDELNSAKFVVVTDPDTVEGMEYLVSKGVISEERKDIILNEYYSEHDKFEEEQ
jgi:hypothetical protein